MCGRGYKDACKDVTPQHATRDRSTTNLTNIFGNDLDQVGFRPGAPGHVNPPNHHTSLYISPFDIDGSGVGDAFHLQVFLVQVGGHELLGDATVETLACEIGPQGGERERRGVGEAL